jgi:hypothetical protein
MTFEEILDQAIALLQRRGRVTYRTLKRQFQLDDAALEDLKNELIEGQRLAVDEGGNVLVWTGTGVPPSYPTAPPVRRDPVVPLLRSVGRCAVEIMKGQGDILHCWSSPPTV